MSLVSVIIPAYNGEKFIPQSIGSVLAQTHTDWELIVVDDGSTDGTRAVVEGFCKKDPRIKYFYEENSGGPARPKNLGMKHAVGEYIAYLDQDDEWLPEKLEKQIRLFERSSNIGLVGCDAALVDNKGKVFSAYKTPEPKSIFPYLLERDYIYSNSSVVIRREVVKKVGARDEKLKYAEDWDMWIRIAVAGYVFDFVHEPLLKYLVYPENTTKKLGFAVRARETEYIYRKHEALYQKYHAESAGLFHVGVKFCLGGDQKTGRKFFRGAIKKSPSNIGAWIGFKLSFLGGLGRAIMRGALEASRWGHGRTFL